MTGLVGKEVRVVWLDSYGVQAGWQDIKDYSAEPLEVTSLGKVVYETDDVVALAHNYAEEGEHTPEQANGIIVIPRVSIKTISSCASCPEPESEQTQQHS